MRLCDPGVFGLSGPSHHATEGKVLQPARRLVPLVVLHHHRYHLYFSGGLGPRRSYPLVPPSLYFSLHSEVGRPGALGLSARSCTPGPRGDLARVRAGGRGGRPALHLTPRRVPSMARGPGSRSCSLDAGAFGQSGNTRPPGDAPVLFSYIPRVLCPLQGGVIRPTPTGDQCVGPARALV